MSEVSFVHLSDIHFRKTSGNGYDIDSDLRNAVVIDIKHNLRENFKNINGILISGDIAFSGQDIEYQIANEFLKEIAKCMEMDSINIYCVPGNHDVNQNISKRSRSIYNAQCDIDNAQTLDDADCILEKYMLDIDNPDLLYKTLEQYNKFAAPYKCNIDSKNPVWEQYFELDNNMKLKIIGLNSCIISNHDDHKEKQVVRKMVIGQSQIPKYEDNVVCISLCHHPVEFWKFIEMMEDRLNKRIDVQLYGHKHEQAISKSPERLIINAGATQPIRGKNWRPRYNWISFECISKENSRYIRVKTFPRILSDDRDRFVSDVENCDDEKNYFLYELDIDRKREKNLNDNKVLCCSEKEKTIKKQEIDSLMQGMGYCFLDLSDIQRFEILSELKLLRNEYGSENIIQVMDLILEDAKKKDCLEKFYTLIKQKRV